MPNAREKAELIQNLEQELALWRYLRIGLLLLGALLIALSFVVRNPPTTTTVKAWPPREPAKAMELEVELPRSTNPLLLIGLVLFVTPLAPWRGDRTQRTLLLLLKAQDDVSSH